jgi:hypothetical protein
VVRDYNDAAQGLRLGFFRLLKTAAVEKLRRPLDIEGWESGGEPTVGWWQCGDGEVALPQSHVAKGR